MSHAQALLDSVPSSSRAPRRNANLRRMLSRRRKGVRSGRAWSRRSAFARPHRRRNISSRRVHSRLRKKTRRAFSRKNRKQNEMTKLALWNAQQALIAVFQDVLAANPEFNRLDFSTQLQLTTAACVPVFFGPNLEFNSDNNHLKALEIYLQNGYFYSQFNPIIPAAYGFAKKFSASTLKTKRRKNWKNFSMADKICFAVFYSQFAENSQAIAHFNDERTLVQNLSASVTKRIHTAISHILDATPTQPPVAPAAAAVPPEEQPVPMDEF